MLWSPVTIRENGLVRFRPNSPNVPTEQAGWMAFRSPPPSEKNLTGIVHPSSTPSVNQHSLVLDAGSALSVALQKRSDLELLFDCRFVLRITSQRLIRELFLLHKRGINGLPVEIHLQMHGRFHLPILLLKTEREIFELAKLCHDGCLSVLQDDDNLATLGLTKTELNTIHIDFIRTLEADAPYDSRVKFDESG